MSIMGRSGVMLIGASVWSMASIAALKITGGERDFLFILSLLSLVVGQILLGVKDKHVGS